MALLIASVDMQSAFDRIRPALAATALAERGGHPAHIAAVLPEMLPATAVPLACVVREPFHTGRGGRQGTPRTPAFWNQYIAGCLEGCCGGADPWAVVFWADNLFLVGSDSAGVQRRLVDIQTTFAMRGLACSDTSLAVFRNPEADDGPLCLPATAQLLAEVAELRVLGPHFRPMRQ